jgi:hypothetical protein
VIAKITDGTFNIFPDMFMSFFHSVLEYPCPTILRDMCNATWHVITYKINCGRKGKPQVIHVDRIRKKYPQNLPGEEGEQIESHEETVAKDDLPNESMKTDKVMEFDSNKEISDNVGIDSEVIDKSYYSGSPN